MNWGLLSPRSEFTPLHSSCPLLLDSRNFRRWVKWVDSEWGFLAHPNQALAHPFPSREDTVYYHNPGLDLSQGLWPTSYSFTCISAWGLPHNTHENYCATCSLVQKCQEINTIRAVLKQWLSGVGVWIPQLPLLSGGGDSEVHVPHSFLEFPPGIEYQLSTSQWAGSCTPCWLPSLPNPTSYFLTVFSEFPK